MFPFKPLFFKRRLRVAIFPVAFWLSSQLMQQSNWGLPEANNSKENMNKLQTHPPGVGDWTSNSLATLSTKCPSCGSNSSSSHHRIVIDACGHSKCRKCLLVEESECSQCLLELHERKEEVLGPQRCSVIVPAVTKISSLTPCGQEDFENMLEGIVLSKSNSGCS